MTEHKPEQGRRVASGGPGVEPRWERADKDGIGTAYSGGSRVWFTLRNGHLTEVYYPTVDRPQISSLRFVLIGPDGLVHDEREDRSHLTTPLGDSLGYEIAREDQQAGYSLTKRVITDPHLPVVLIRTEFTGDPESLGPLKLYVLCEPHLQISGWGNNAYTAEFAGRRMLLAEKDGVWLAMAANRPFSHLSVGYVGGAAALGEIASGRALDQEADEATDGHVGLTGEIALGRHPLFTLGLAFGESRHSAVTALLQALNVSFDKQERRFREQWERANNGRAPLDDQSGDGGALYRISYRLLLAHEDKTFQGAMVASLAIPWGNVRNAEENKGGYHLVWTRDMILSALGILAAGNQETPLRALIYLAASQQSDGNFPQNFWVDGEPYWRQQQLDEVAYPLLSARRLLREGALQEFDPTVMVMRGARYLIAEGPVTRQERWEEQGGYSPATLAIVIAACLCAAAFTRDGGDEATARFMEDYADWVRDHLVDWTVTNRGSLLAGTPRHFVRINPCEPGEVRAAGDVDRAEIALTSQPPGAPPSYPARNVVDPSFLELVRVGVLAPDDPLVVDTLKVVDATLKQETRWGPVWRRYNHDGYGQRDDGSAYDGWGRGRAWPLLTLERARYELVAGGDVRSLLRTVERLAGDSGLIPEQVWDEDDIPEEHLVAGGPTGSASPLLWAHAAYVTLLRSLKEGAPYDRVPEVAARYLAADRPPGTLEIWSFRYPTAVVARGCTVRIMANDPFRLRWSGDGWSSLTDTESSTTTIGLHFADVPGDADRPQPLQFTFFWSGSHRWENRNFTIGFREDAP